MDFFISILFLEISYLRLFINPSALGQKEAEFTEKIEKNQGIIHKICRSYTNDTHSHEDLFQEIVLQLWKSYDTFKGDSKFSTWMYRVALNTAITLYRKKKRKPYENSLDNTHFEPQSEEVDYETEAQIKRLYSAIKELNDIERALVLLYLEDMSYREISETLGISEVNARVKMNRTKKKLREIMETA